MNQALTFFQATPGGRNVIEKFIKSDLKRLPGLSAQLVDQLKVLERTPIATLRETGRLEHVEGELLSFRFKSSDHWLRLLVACWPQDSDIVVLLPVIKKRNRLDRDDIDQALRNLRLLKTRATNTP